MRLVLNFYKNSNKYLFWSFTVFGCIILFNIFKHLMISYFFAHYVPAPISVSAVKAKKEAWQPRILAVGDLMATQGVDITSQASGDVVAIHFKSGQFVKQNDDLIDLDDAIDRAVLQSNKAELELQKINYKRQEELFKRGATPSSLVDESRAKWLKAEADVQKIGEIIAQKHIKAPFTGKLGIRTINLGQYITPGQTSIVTLQSQDPLYIEFSVPEQVLKHLYVKQPILFALSQGSKFYFKAQINAINSKVDLNTHNVKVQAKISNCPINILSSDIYKKFLVKSDVLENKLVLQCQTKWNNKNDIRRFYFTPGMFVFIEVLLPLQKSVIVVPETAIAYSAYGNSVYVVKKNTQNNLYVKKVFVTTGAVQGNYIIVEKGINEGDLVVNAGDLKLQDNTSVVINNDVKLPDIPINQIGQ